MATQARRPTIIDIAKRADVSFKTVSRVLNENPRVAEELRERVLKAMAELDYQPNLAARALAGRRSYSIALLVDQGEFFNEDNANAYMAPYLVDLQAGALRACREAGYHFFIEPFDPRAPTWSGDLRNQLTKIAVDGVVLAPPAADRLALLEALESWNIPYVRIAPGTEIDRAPSVAMDEYGGTVAMTEHLLALGHRRFAFVSGPEAHIAASVRLVAFRDTLARCGVSTQPIIVPGDFTFAAGLAAGEMLFALPDRPTAIFAANDFMAAGVVAAATHQGVRVPDEVSIGGFDDTAVSRFVWPPLTTVRQPIRVMAQAAIRYLLDLAGGRESATRRTEFPFQLVVRSSTGPAGTGD
jgi:LacI family transcriptional regulator